MCVVVFCGLLLDGSIDNMIKNYLFKILIKKNKNCENVMGYLNTSILTTYDWEYYVVNFIKI